MISLYAADSQSCPVLSSFYSFTQTLRGCDAAASADYFRNEGGVAGASDRPVRQVCGDPDSFCIVSCVDGRAIILGLQPPTARGNRLQQQRHYQPNLIQLGLI